MHVAIIGNGITGVTAALRIRKKQPGWKITLISGESKYHYSRPALMYVFMGHMRYQDVKPYEDSFWDEQRIDLLRGWVRTIDVDEKHLVLHGGSRIPYDKLLIATGSKPNKFGWPGQDLEGVQGLWGLYDLKRLYEAAERTRSAVIVGGGLIGIELAEMLHSRGIHMTFLVREESYWNNIIPREESAMLNRIIRAQGMDLLLETQLKEIVDDGRGRCRAVVTDKGEHIDCQLVGLTAGVSPNVDWLKDAPIERRRGVLVDWSLRTSAPDVFAAGDCAEIVTEGDARNVIQQVWYTGKMQGEVVGDVIAGEERTYEVGIWFNSAKFLDLEYQVYGRVNMNVPGEENLYWEHADGLHSLRIVHKDDAVIGFNLMGLRWRHEVAERWLAEGRSVAHVLEHMEEANFDPELYESFERDIRAAFVGVGDCLMEAELVDYDFDEEAVGFGEPQTPQADPATTPSGAQRAALALVGLGLLGLVVQTAGGPLAGTWGGFLLSFGLLALGAVLTFWLALRDTVPGIKHDGVFFKSLLAKGAVGWVAGIVMTGFYVLIYWYPELLGHREGAEPTGLVRVVDPLSRALTGYPSSRWFLYGVLYTLAILVFGVRMFMKYRHNRYQLLRTSSVMFFQLVTAWFLPNLLVRLQKPYMEFNGVWPLKQDYLWPSKVAGEFAGAGSFGTFLLVFAIAAVVATPILTYFYGKRWYCSWVCGCGGLAETLGDPWRQLSDKSTRAWKIERWLIHSVLIAVLVTTVMLWIDYLNSGSLYGSWSGRFREWYGFYIGAIFSGVVGVGFYPLFGSRVWCRFGCPQAAILGLWQRLFSRFRITTNGGQCMSCGNCSTYCEMGIDVRAYAQRGENIVRASCVGCGVCSAVCPRGVLKLENGLPGDRFEGADRPWENLIASLKEPDIYGYEAWHARKEPGEGS